jgi:hypothetical protein
MRDHRPGSGRHAAEREARSLSALRRAMYYRASPSVAIIFKEPFDTLALAIS